MSTSKRKLIFIINLFGMELIQLEFITVFVKAFRHVHGHKIYVNDERVWKEYVHNRKTCIMIEPDAPLSKIPLKKTFNIKKPIGATVETKEFNCLFGKDSK